MAQYLDFDRTAWAARRGTAAADAPAVVPAPGDLVSPEDQVLVYAPLADYVLERAGGRAPFVVGITGSVAVGKSAAAAALAGALSGEGAVRAVALVCTDGFLFPNRVLAARGLTERKGFPETFDHDALTRFLLAVRSGAAETRAPRYSHSTYDIVDGETQVVHRPDVLILEGLPFPDEHVDLTIYLDAREDDIERWYVARFGALCEEARTDDSSFFAYFRAASATQVNAFARQVWDSINRVNLEEHILPVRESSDVILEKGPDHAIQRVRLRTA